MNLMKRLSRLESALPLLHEWLIMRESDGKLVLVTAMLPCKPPESHEADMKTLVKVMNNPQSAHKLKYK